MLTTTLEWHNAKEYPHVKGLPNDPEGRKASNLCLVRINEGYGEALQLAYYIIPAKKGDVDKPCWIDLNGNELFYDVLFWAELTETYEKLSQFCVTF